MPPFQYTGLINTPVAPPLYRELSMCHGDEGLRMAMQMMGMADMRMGDYGSTNLGVKSADAMTSKQQFTRAFNDTCYLLVNQHESDEWITASTLATAIKFIAEPMKNVDLVGKKGPGGQGGPKQRFNEALSEVRCRSAYVQGICMYILGYSVTTRSRATGICMCATGICTCPVPENVSCRAARRAKHVLGQDPGGARRVAMMMMCMASRDLGQYGSANVGSRNKNVYASCQQFCDAVQFPTMISNVLGDKAFHDDWIALVSDTAYPMTRRLRISGRNSAGGSSKGGPKSQFNLALLEVRRRCSVIMGEADYIMYLQ